jgi:shikimate kinase
LKKIALVGLPGSGKTSVAEALEKKFGWNWIDLDAEIERRQNKKISAIIREEGEQRFRDLELEEIQHALSVPELNANNLVLSLGGGALLNNAVKALLTQNCFTVCLEASIETLLKRVKQDEVSAQKAGQIEGIRPLLVGSGVEFIERHLKELVDKRRSLYDIADLKINTDEKSPGEISKIIVEAVS